MCEYQLNGLKFALQFSAAARKGIKDLKLLSFLTAGTSKKSLISFMLQANPKE